MDKELLFKPRLQEADVELPGVGTVRVRGLTQEERGECVREGDIDAEGNPVISKGAAIARRLIAKAMIDPPMTLNDVDAWQRAAPAGELDQVALKVQELSGMLPGATKEAYKSVRGRPGR